ncbi:MAG: gliding motility-associated C-terminal domain-containing protein, partial [Bacteroidota bacterium]
RSNGGDVVCLGNNVPGSITGITDRCSDKNGAHVDFQINLITNCVTYDPVSIGTDTACIVITDNMGNEHRTNFIITVRAITPEFINDTIFINQTIIYCADTSELPGEIVSIDNFCPAESGEFVDFFLDPSSMCVEYTGLEIGQDSACIVFCDINGLCDTTFITTTVVEYFEPPIAMNDTARTTRGTPVVIDVKENDLVFGGVDTAFVVTPPLYGTARLNLDCSITYEPNERFCDRSDEFEYVVCNPNGCDTAKVEVFIECVGIFVFNAVSPNGDGSNDTFFIAGLDDKPENNLKIFNRWGNLVYETNNYQNTWDGTWDADKDLPDGTYFYILTIDDNGTESVFRGYLELFR